MENTIFLSKPLIKNYYLLVFYFNYKKEKGIMDFLQGFFFKKKNQQSYLPITLTTNILSLYSSLSIFLLMFWSVLLGFRALLLFII